MNRNPEQNELDVPTRELCGADIAAVDGLQATEIIVEYAVRHRPLQVHLCNSYTLSLIDRDAGLAAALRGADLNLADGAPVAWFLRGFGVRGPIRGLDLLREVAQAGTKRGISHYFWGGAPGVAELAAAQLEAEVVGTQIAGTESPPFGVPSDDELDVLAERLTSTGAGVLWVGMGTPKQDHLVPRLASRVGIPVVPVGAAFDFLAGTVPEAPRVLHNSGLEWAHRLVKEPRRLWRRYLLDSPRFLLTAWRHRNRSGP